MRHTAKPTQAKKPDKLKTLNISVAFVVGPLCGILSTDAAAAAAVSSCYSLF